MKVTSQFCVSKTGPVWDEMNRLLLALAFPGQLPPSACELIWNRDQLKATTRHKEMGLS